MNAPKRFAALAAVAFLWPVGSQAQVGFIMDMYAANVCMTQNWDTPSMQTWLNQMPRAQRMRIYSSMDFQPAQKKCLIEKKPVPVALCEKVIAKRLGPGGPPPVGGGAPFLSEGDAGEALERFQGSACMSARSAASDADWLPADLRPSVQTKNMLARAAKGDVPAMAAAARMYEVGGELPPDAQKAGYWRMKAAAAGDASMQHAMFGAAFRGFGKQQDLMQALAWLEKSAKQGYVPAQGDLGAIYLMGHDGAHIKPDPSKAVEWLTKSANAGDGESAYQLGEAYSNGTHLPLDLGRAAMWYRKGVDRKDGRSMVKLAKLVQGTDHKEAMALYRSADAIDQSEASAGLASYFPWGTMPATDAEIVEAQKQHAQLGDVQAQIAMAIRCGTGAGIDQDAVAALDWWTQAAETGDAMAQRQVGRHLALGIATPVNLEKAKAWLQKAADQGDAAAQEALAYLYVSTNASADGPDHIRKNNAIALDLMRKAAAQGSTAAKERAAQWSEVLVQ